MLYFFLKVLMLIKIRTQAMKANYFFSLFVLCLFSNQSMALFQGGYEYRVITANLQPTPGCKNKKEAAKQAASGYRFKKHSKVLCQHIGYGWRLAEVKSRGEVVCELCEDMAESIENYRCYVKNVTLKCGLTKRGW